MRDRVKKWSSWQISVEFVRMLEGKRCGTLSSCQGKTKSPFVLKSACVDDGVFAQNTRPR